MVNRTVTKINKKVGIMAEGRSASAYTIPKLNTEKKEATQTFNDIPRNILISRYTKAVFIRKTARIETLITQERKRWHSLPRRKRSRPYG